jgi:four helix bundle protein
MAKLPRYRSLVAWQRADDLFIRLHHLSRQHFPADERYELTSQLRRAAFSVPANIVEGTARYHPRETLQFLRTAFASLVGTGYCLHVARRLEYITETLFDELDLEVRRVAAPLLGMIRVRSRSGAKPSARAQRARPRRA